MTWLYTYENESADGGRFYTGIGTDIARAWQPHNPEAEALRNNPKTVILRTADRFSTRKDALMAEAIAIHVASFFGARIILDTTDGDQILRDDESSQRTVTDGVTNISGMVQTKHLVPAHPMQVGAPPVRYSDLTGEHAAIVMAGLEELDVRPAISGATDPEIIAHRAARFWHLLARIDSAAATDIWPRRLLLVSKGQHVILGDWDLASGPDSMRPLAGREFKGQPAGDRWCEFTIGSPRWTFTDARVPTGVVGRTLVFDTDYGPKNMQGSVAGWSEDLRIAWGMTS